MIGKMLMNKKGFTLVEVIAAVALMAILIGLAGTNLIKKYPQTLYYSLFNSNETEKYKNDYNNWFGVRKQTVGAKYDLLGYDLTMIAVKGIKTSNDNLIINPQMSDIKFLQSEPQLEFIDNRWLNTNYYLFFWDNITIKEIKN